MAGFPDGWTKTLDDLFREWTVTRREVGPPETEWAMAYERSLLPPGTRFPRDGDVYEALGDVPVQLLTHWKAPFTGGADGVLPRGTRIRVFLPATSWAPAVSEPIAVYAEPVDNPALEAALVPRADREHPSYGGYSLSIKTAMLSREFRLVGVA